MAKMAYLCLYLE